MDERKPPTTVAETDPESAEHWFQYFVQGLKDSRSAAALEQQKDKILTDARAQIERVRSFNPTAPFNVKRIVEQKIQEYYHQRKKEKAYRFYEQFMEQEGVPHTERVPFRTFDKALNTGADFDPVHPAMRSKQSSAVMKKDAGHAPMAQILHIERFGLHQSQIVVHGLFNEKTGHVATQAQGEQGYQEYRIDHFIGNGKAVVEPVDSKTKQPIPQAKKITYDSSYLIPLEYLEAQRAASEKA